MTKKNLTYIVILSRKKLGKVREEEEEERQEIKSQRKIKRKAGVYRLERGMNMKGIGLIAEYQETMRKITKGHQDWKSIKIITN